MNEVLKYRLTGALVLLLAALVLTLILPRPGAEPELEPGLKKVVMDLRAEPANPATSPPVVTPLPQEIASSPAPEAEPAIETQPAVEATPPEPLKAEVKTPLAKKETAMPELPPPPAATPSPPPEAIKAPAEPAKSASATPGSWYVQAGAFGDINNAHQLLDKLRAQGLSGWVSPIETANGVLYRARLGPYADRAAAEAARAKAMASGISQASVVAE